MQFLTKNIRNTYIVKQEHIRSFVDHQQPATVFISCFMSLTSRYLNLFHVLQKYPFPVFANYQRQQHSSQPNSQKKKQNKQTF